MADKWCGSPHPAKMAWAKMREFGLKFTWWCFWVSLFWINSYIYLCVDIKIHICMCIHICICNIISNNLIYLTLYRWTKGWSDTHYISVFHMIYVSPLQAIPPTPGSLRASVEPPHWWYYSRAQRWYRFTCYTHTGSLGVEPSGV